MNNFQVSYDEAGLTISFTDTTASGENQLVVTYPDGIQQDFGKILTTANSWMLSIPARTGLDGKIMKGEYTFVLSRYTVGGTTPTGTQTGTFDYQLECADMDITESFDVFTPLFTLTDATDYSKDDFTASTARQWDVSRGSQFREWEGTSQTQTLNDNGYHAGTYEWTLTSTTTYTQGWVTVILTCEKTGTKTINKPPMLPELAALFNCLYAKIVAKNCCKDAAYTEMLADFNLASSMAHIFILNGQAGITGTAQSNLLFGSDCNLGILGLLKKWGCEDAEIEDTLLSAYDWCLCDAGGGGGTVVKEFYEAGTGCWISADLVGTTYSATSGIGTFVLSTGCSLFGGTVRGDSSTASHTSNGATNSFKLVIPVDADNANLTYASALLATVNVWDASNDDPTAAAPWVKDEGSVQKRITDISNGEISFVFAGIGATYSGGWAITFETP